MALEQLAALKERMEGVRKEIETEAQKAFGETVKDIFVKYPTLNTFEWKQYTQYFNDGDECTFNAYVDPDGIDINGDSGSEVGMKVDYSGKPPYLPIPQDKRHPLQAAQEEISTLLAAIGDDFLKAMFGDHIKVVVKRTATGVEVEKEEYSHD